MSRRNRQRAPATERVEVPAPARTTGVRPAATSRLLAAVFVGLLAFIVYVPGFSNGFVYDAEVAVAQDERVHTLDNALQLLAEPYWGFDRQRLGLYRPVVTLSFAVDWALHDGQPGGFHVTNALAHATASILVFLLVAGFVAVPAAFAGAALFAVHPLHTEAVAGIFGRADVFAAVFCFAALFVWLRRPVRDGLLLFAVPAFFLLALGSKESAIVLPALLILADAATGRLQRTRVRVWFADRLWCFAALGLVAVLYLLARYAVLGVFTPHSPNPIMAADASDGTRIRTALQIWPEFIRLFLFPRTLLADYGPRMLMPAQAWTPRVILGALILLGAVVGGTVAFARGRGRVALALLWVPVVMLPASNLIMPIGILLAERTLYMALFAPVLGVALVIDRLDRTPRRAAFVVVALIALFMAARTTVRLPDWRTTDSIFAALIRDRPDLYRAQWQQGRRAAQHGDLNTALAYYQATIALWPYSRPVFIEAGDVATAARQPLIARAFAEQALGQFPDDAIFLRRHAVAAITLGDTVAARASVVRGLRVAPADPLFVMMSESLRK